MQGSLTQGSKTAFTVAAFPESLHLAQTAHFGLAEYAVMSFGDTDHDGQNEVASCDWISQAWRLHIFEAHGGTVYSDEYVGPVLLPYALCDLDRDGRGEVLGQWGYPLKVYEAADSSSYPSQLVWTSPNLSNVVGEGTIGDTDLDGRMEIIHSVSTLGRQGYLSIFENVDNNMFTQVCSLQVTTGAGGKKRIADLDLDGIPEIAFGTSYGGIYIVKSTGNNTWRTQWMTPTDLRPAYAASIGPDLDGNGKPELFIAGAVYEGWTTLILEASGVDQYSVVDTLRQSDGWSGVACNAVGNFTGSGRYEYAVQGYLAIWIYGATGPGRWELISTLANSDGKYTGLYAVDLNQNGRDELFWGSEEAPSTIYEHRSLVTDIQFPPPGPFLLGVAPNPVRWEAVLQLPVGLPMGSRVCVYDVAGRLVQRLPLGSSSPQARWRTNGLGAGVYFVQIEGSQGKPLARGQVTVVR